ncbi:hypothetical protein V8G54_011606 [Vigna mungo]|uniref:Probable magnesium transporter n=1 Tax=Vigna mungo TaxID=3915 RepID=A0AAQ3NPG0_VIGMU
MRAEQGVEVSCCSLRRLIVRQRSSRCSGTFAPALTVNISVCSNPAIDKGVAHESVGVKPMTLVPKEIPVKASERSFSTLYSDVYVCGLISWFYKVIHHLNNWLRGMTNHPLLRFENDLVVAVGKGEPAAVMTEYGFRHALSIDEYASCFENIDPLAPYKKWTSNLAIMQTKFNESFPRNDVLSKRVQAAFIVSDPVDWSRDIQQCRGCKFCCICICPSGSSYPSWRIKYYCEKLHHLGISGCVMCIIGSIIIVIHAPREQPIKSVQEIWDMATQPAFLAHGGSVIVLVFILVFHFAPRCGHTNVLVYTGICSLMGSLSVMSVKALGTSLKLTFEGKNQLIYPETWFFMLVVAICVIPANELS